MYTTDIYSITKLDVIQHYNQEIFVKQGKSTYEITTPFASNDYRMLCNVAKCKAITIYDIDFCRAKFVLNCQQFTNTVFRLLAYASNHTSFYAESCYDLASAMLETIGIELV